MMNSAIFLMAIVGILLIGEIINFFLKYKRTKIKQSLVSCIIMTLSFIFWAISMFLMVQKAR